ncbi:MAG: ATP-dependent RNA helicase HrpA [Deltaproteobacteria bacterium]|nr:ATP-dependent RNA helicase HrpA [Deltaproteobacteria bacterium]
MPPVRRPEPPAPRPPSPDAGDGDGGAAPAVLRPGLTLSERVRFPAELPITARVIDIANAIDAHQVIIVAGETGSGKTTQLPKICLAMGRGVNGQIACTQPRRIAATSVAGRVAQELDSQLGDIVGYKVRFNDRVKKDSYIKFMTDGMLLAEIQGDAMLRGYDTIIIDEAHERSLNIDFLLGFLKRIVARRPELRVIISSATLETQRFADFFGGAPVIQVSGRTYPVDVLYRPPREDEADLAELVANAVNEITELDPRNDVLVFLPGEREIREAMGELEQRALPHTVLLPLYARLSPADQQKVFTTAAKRRVVLATNVAETSLTIPGIVYVVDAGVARVNRYNVRTGVTQLLIEPVSQASANQRKGRCGRTESGVCFRLYEEQDFLGRPAFTDPEIKRVGLAGVILRMKSLRLGDVESFPFLDPPQKRAVDEGYRVLEELGALDEDGELTEIGEQLGRLPLDPRLGRMILAARELGSLREVLIIAAALGLQDPRDRPQAARDRADEAHRKFKDEGSDFASYLKLWAFWQEARARSSKNQMYRLARDNFLNFNRMREWEDIHEQLVRVMRELEVAPNDTPASAEQIHRALLPGLLSKIGMWMVEARVYTGARQIRFMIHPSSTLGRKPPPWIMAAELVETSQLFARSVAKLDPSWVEAAAGDLCRHSYGDPHWEMKAAQVVAKEQVTLYGLPIVKNRKVNYGPLDPTLARTLFITHALVRHEYATKGAFMEHNRLLLEEVQRLRNKARKSDMVADEYALCEFFEQRIPAGVYSGATFETWRKDAEARDRKVLFLSLEDVLLEDDKALVPAQYPDQLIVGGTPLPLAYQFEPGHDQDGITITVPLALLPQLDPAVFAWTIPGWHLTKIEALIDALPKPVRKALMPQMPLEELAVTLASELKPFDGPMLAALERAIYARTGERVHRDAWDLRAVPQYLHFGFRIVDEHDKVLAEGKDLADLQRTLEQRAKALWASAPRARHERTGMKTWDLDALPASVTLDIAGRKVLAYPALVDTETAVDVRLLESPEAAIEATRAGLRRLLLLQLGTTPAKLESQLPATLAQGPLLVSGWPETPRRQIVLRALDEAFRLDDPAAFPRSKAAFVERVTASAQLPAILARLARTAGELSAELEKARAAVKALTQRPGAPRPTVEDLQTQLAHLAPPDVLRTMPHARLGHLPRYLKAIQVRLQRLANDPPKDAQKATQVTPLWQGYLKKRDEFRARGRSMTELEDFGWLVEELRVQVFAPELKTAVPISLPRLQELWASLSR